MKKVLVITLFFLVACTRPLPNLPHYETSQGRSCAFGCQKEHDVCLGKAYGLRARGIISVCNQKLDECYQLCLEEDKQ